MSSPKSKKVQDAEQLGAIINRLLKKKVLRKPLSLEEITYVVQKAKHSFRVRPTPLLEIEPPVIICGDIHGQYKDLIRLFSLNGPPQHKRYLFLGDYVDRGEHQLEVICTMFALKIAFPRSFYILRGNHETREINVTYGFFEECELRFPGKRLWHQFNEVFDWLPLAALVGGKLFCMHGGIPNGLDSFDQIRRVPLPTECPREGIVPDLLWSDPADYVLGFIPSPRGLGHMFGADELETFCQRLDIDLVVRAHQVVQEGYQFFANQRLVTIFSAPDYGGVTNNDAATLIVQPDLRCTVRVLRPSRAGH